MPPPETFFHPDSRSPAREGNEGKMSELLQKHNREAATREATRGGKEFERRKSDRNLVRSPASHLPAYVVL